MRLIGLAVVLIVGLTLAQFAPALSVETQPASSVRRIGFLSGNSSESTRGFVEEFRRGLREQGYVEGQNIHVEYRWADGKADRLSGLVTDLISLRVEIIVAVGSPSARAAHQATRTLPIVGSRRPPTTSAVVTGFTSFGLDLTAKQLELLREAVPDMKRLAMLWTPTNPLHPGTVRDLGELTRSRGMQIQPLKIVSPDEIQGAFRAAATQRAAAMWVVGDPMFAVHRSRIATLAMDARLPTSFFGRQFVEAGGLMSYAPDLNHIYRQAATHVDKILKGAKPAELPIEDPTKFELVISLKTAKALGLTIPQTLLLRADQVIE